MAQYITISPATFSISIPGLSKTFEVTIQPNFPRCRDTSIQSMNETERPEKRICYGCRSDEQILSDSKCEPTVQSIKTHGYGKDMEKQAISGEPGSSHLRNQSLKVRNEVLLRRLHGVDRCRRSMFNSKKLCIMCTSNQFCSTESKIVSVRKK